MKNAKILKGDVLVPVEKGHVRNLSRRYQVKC